MNPNEQTELLPLSSIVIGERIRKENGAMEELAESIRERGLINPVTVMCLPDNKYQLIAGLRRLEAMRLLGATNIRATVLSPMDADEMLRTEIAENEQRKEFTLAERLEYARKIEAVEAQLARERQIAGLNGQHVVLKRAQRQDGRTRDIVAKKAGFGSHAQMERAEAVATARPDLLDPIYKAHGVSTNGKHLSSVVK